MGVVVAIRLSVVTFSGCCLFEVFGDADEGEADDDDITLESGFIRVSSGHGGFMDRQEDRQTDRQTGRVDEDGKHNSIEFKTFWKRRLSIELQRCNAQVIIRKLSRDSSTHTYSNQFYR